MQALRKLLLTAADELDAQGEPARIGDALRSVAAGDRQEVPVGAVLSWSSLSALAQLMSVAMHVADAARWAAYCVAAAAAGQPEYPATPHVGGPMPWQVATDAVTPTMSTLSLHGEQETAALIAAVSGGRNPAVAPVALSEQAEAGLRDAARALVEVAVQASAWSSFVGALIDEGHAAEQALAAAVDRCAEGVDEAEWRAAPTAVTVRIERGGETEGNAVAGSVLADLAYLVASMLWSRRMLMPTPSGSAPLPPFPTSHDSFTFVIYAESYDAMRELIDGVHIDDEHAQFSATLRVGQAVPYLDALEGVADRADAAWRRLSG